MVREVTRDTGRGSGRCTCKLGPQFERSYTAHSFARPFKDAWVDMTEFVSLLSTLFIFQGGMVWTVSEDPGGSLSVAIEKMSIALVCATSALALFVEVKVYAERHHGEDETRVMEKDLVDEQDNPVHENVPENDKPFGSDLAAAHQSSQRVLSVEGLDFD